MRAGRIVSVTLAAAAFAALNNEPVGACVVDHIKLLRTAHQNGARPHHARCVDKLHGIRLAEAIFTVGGPAFALVRLLHLAKGLGMVRLL